MRTLPSRRANAVRHRMPFAVRRCARARSVAIISRFPFNQAS
ncbi:Uncharacterised protein [Streptococcus pneumoniae]|nr:Uncharacterised protein [Streptococcus pneumoniae]